MAYRSTTLQTCLVHVIRNSLALAGWQDRKALAVALRAIYTAASAEAASAALDAFAEGPWGRRFPPIVKMWRQAWEHVNPFFGFPPEVRRVIYTTNALESVHARIRKIIKTRGHFPTDEAATKLIWLALRNITANWGLRRPRCTPFFVPFVTSEKNFAPCLRPLRAFYEAASPRQVVVLSPLFVRRSEACRRARAAAEAGRPSIRALVLESVPRAAQDDVRGGHAISVTVFTTHPGTKRVDPLLVASPVQARRRRQAATRDRSNTVASRQIANRMRLKRRASATTAIRFPRRAAS